MSLPDPWEPIDLDAVEIDPLPPGHCHRCSEPESDHCSECGGCLGNHAGYCPQDPDQIARHRDRGMDRWW